MESNKEVEEYSPYCPICTGCGEEGCCSPLGCQMHPDGQYCESYLRDLRFGYKMYSEMMELLYDNNKEVIDQVYDKVWEQYYNKPDTDNQ